jgi:putative membrane protein
MFIDYITLMLINMVAGLVLLADFVYRGLDGANLKRWIPGFGLVGAIALITGLHMTLTWPVPGSFNISFGETTVLFGGLYVAAAIAIAQGWDLFPLTVYAFFAGLTSIVVGARMIDLGQTQQPLVAGLGFILTGLGGVLAAPTLVYLRGNKNWRTLGAGVLLLAALVWAIIGYRAYWGHMKGFSDWQPPVMRVEPQE